jgi:hypothetical protein
MDVTITNNEVAAFIEPNIPLLEPHPNFESIRVLRRHSEHSLQHLPCPQSAHLGWKGLVMLRTIYALLTINAFCTPNIQARWRTTPMPTPPISPC